MPTLTRRYNVKDQPAPSLLRNRGPSVVATVSVTDEHAKSFSANKDLPKPVQGIALIDTGASLTCIDNAAAREAGLAVVDVGTISSATDTAVEVPIYAGKISVPGLPSLPVTGAYGLDVSSQGLIAIIGRDVLEKCVFVYNGTGAVFSISL